MAAPMRVTSVRLNQKADAALARLSAGTGKDQSEVIRDLILQSAERRETAPAAPGMDLATAKRCSKSLMDLLAVVATALEVQDRDSAVEMVGILENRLRYWREDRQTPEERMRTALGHVKAVMEGTPQEQRAALVQDAVDFLTEQAASQ